MMNERFDLGGVVVATTLAFKEDPSAPAGLAVDIAGGSYGGRTRSPRGPLSSENETRVRADTKKALDYLASRR